MSTRRAKREAVVKLQLLDRTPVDLEGAARRSPRNDLAPKRLKYSPEVSPAETQQRKRRTRAQDDRNSQNNREDIKEEQDVGNSAAAGHGGLSAYELERLENIRQNQAFLSSISLFRATEDLKELTRPKPSQRGLMRSQAAVKEVLPARKSLRLQKKEAEILTLPPEPRGTLIYEQSSSVKKPPGPLAMGPINMEEGSKLPSQLLELCSEDSREERKMDLDLKEYRCALKNMRITEDRVAKVVKDRIFSAAFHPCSSSLLMAAGDKWGKLKLHKKSSGWLVHIHNREMTDH